MSGYIVIPNWSDFQHYHDRTPPWIKLHVDILGNDGWLKLTPADRVLLLGIWILVSRYGNGRVRADSGWLNAQLGIRKGSLDRLNHAGFIKLRASKAAITTASKVASAEGSKEPKRQRQKTHVEQAARPEIAAIWTEYEQRHPQAVLTKPRRDLITRRLRDYDATTLIAAIHGNHADPYCNGENREGRQYHSFELILRDADHIEKYAAMSSTNRNGSIEWTAEDAARAAEMRRQDEEQRREEPLHR